MSKLSKLKLRVDLPQVLQVNKPVLLGVAGVVMFIVIFGMINAFNPSRQPKAKMDNGSTTIAAITSNATATSATVSSLNSALQNLPQDYRDIEAVKKYTPDVSGNSKAIAEMQRYLASLKSKGTASQSDQGPVVQENNTEDQQTQQAKSSGMFFSGIAPPQDAGALFKSGADGSGSAGSAGQSSGVSSANNINPDGSVSPATNATDMQVQKLSHDAQMEFYNKQNMQAQKLAVLKASDNPEQIYDLHNMIKPASPYELLSGTLIPAVLITGVNTSLAGTVVAQSRFDVYDTVTGKHLLIPKGSRIVGEYDARTTYGQQRVLLTFNRIIRPDGSSILIGKPNAVDLQGQSGVEGKVDNHWGKVLAAATLSTILSVGAGVASDNSGSGNTFYRSSKQNAILGASSGISQTGNALTSRAFDIQPTITLNPGFQFNIIVRRDMVLTPYHKK